MRWQQSLISSIFHEKEEERKSFSTRVQPRHQRRRTVPVAGALFQPLDVTYVGIGHTARASLSFNVVEYLSRGPRACNSGSLQLQELEKKHIELLQSPSQIAACHGSSPEMSTRHTQAHDASPF